MDTDDLSNETYQAVILTAEMFNHDLTLQFGCMAMGCKDEAEYLSTSEHFIKDCLDCKDIDVLMDDMFFGDPPKEKDFKNALLKIQFNINEVNKIPIEKRTFENW